MSRHYTVTLPLIASVVLACGAPDRLALETGFVSSRLAPGSTYTDIVSKWRTDGHKYGVHYESIRAFDTTLRMEFDVARMGDFILDLGFGAHVVAELDRHGDLIGGAMAIRLRYLATDRVEPYFIWEKTADKFTHLWPPQEVDYGFTDAVGFGIRFPNPESSWSYHIDYRWWHNSWGSSVLSDDFRDFFGLDKKGPNPGFEGGGIFLGAAYSF